MTFVLQLVFELAFLLILLNYICTNIGLQRTNNRKEILNRGLEDDFQGLVNYGAARRGVFQKTRYPTLCLKKRGKAPVYNVPFIQPGEKKKKKKKINQGIGTTIAYACLL